MIKRHLEPHIRELLASFRVVTLVGARQVGKTTLVRSLADELPDCRYLTLDSPQELEFARADPETFVAVRERTIVIDEIQRAPDLLLAVKARVDRENRPGQFLLTGSADLLNLKRTPDTLPGRNVFVRLFGLSQAEIAGVDAIDPSNGETVIDQFFHSRVPVVERNEPGIASLLPVIAAGSFPDAQNLTAKTRRRLFNSYVTASVEHDVDEIARIDSKDSLRQMLAQIAARTSGTLNITDLGRAAGVSQHTAQRYARVLRDMFLVEILPAWSRNIDQRQTKLPKAYVSDSGLHGALLGVDVAKLDPIRDGPLIGSSFECFAVNELLKLASLSNDIPTAFHHRDRTGREIDLIFELQNRDLVAIEIKSAATVRAEDFRTINHLAAKVKNQLKAGIVIYAGARTVSFGNRRFAVPVNALWERPQDWIDATAR